MHPHIKTKLFSSPVMRRSFVAGEWNSILAAHCKSLSSNKHLEGKQGKHYTRTLWFLNKIHSKLNMMNCVLLHSCCHSVLCIKWSKTLITVFLQLFVCFCLKAKHGYRNLTGIDYSTASVELARNVLQMEELTDITVKVGSVLSLI